MDVHANAGLALAFFPPKRRRGRIIRPVLAGVLYAGLVSALGQMCGVWPHVGLYIAGALLIFAAAYLPVKKQELAASLLFLACTAALLLWPAAREGAKLISTRLFAVSEAHNAYRYDPLVISLAQSDFIFAQTVAALLLSVAAACAAILSVNRRMAALALFLALAVFESYFGVTPGIVCNLLLFSALALCLSIRAEPSAALRLESILLFAALVILCSALVYLLMPGENPQVEQYSEHLRDELDETVRTQLSSFFPTSGEVAEVRRENSLHAESAGGTDSRTKDYQNYKVKQEYESEISQPNRTRYGKVIWLSLLILALLTLPFVPFLLYDARRRRIRMMCLDFEAPCCALAIHAMFLHALAWLEACGLCIGNRSFSACCGDIAAQLSPTYARHYRSAVCLWQEAEYSSHEMSEAQRTQMREFLEETQRLLYSRAGKLKKLKLKYINCLFV